MPITSNAPCAQVILTLSSGLILPAPSKAATASPSLPEALFREAENLISLIRERLGQSFPSLSTSPDPKVRLTYLPDT